ncbi:AraC family transcriptional regulator [uncultured Kordia sp.]|uniref:helix-turn-helix domain-containing protein n=1 Tax=uncultured Kordia sp. TaxID=507699 RepID=UPI0026280F86|nr:AraC family transcriptional regulator [uncultured Kordia sp.]
MKKPILFTILFFVGMITVAQDKNAMLEEFASLRKQFRNKEIKPEQKEILATKYLEKAKNTKDNRLIGGGFYLLAIQSLDVAKKHQYLDSAISYTQHIKGDEIFPMQGYMNKAHQFFKAKKYQPALDNYFLAAAAEKLNPNIKYKFAIKFNIGLLKRFLGEYEEAEKLFLEYKAYEENAEKMFVSRYIQVLFQLSSIYYETQQVSKSTEMNKKGIELSKSSSNTFMYYSFITNEGINLNLKGEYKASIDSLKKGYPYTNDVNRPVLDFYLGKSYYSSNKKEKGLLYFKKIDSVFNATNNLFPPLRDSYVYLIDDAKQKNDKEQQLYYTNQLIKIDSIIHSEYKYIYKNISKKYDIPSLMSNKERLINELQEENELIGREKKIILMLSILLISIIVGILFYYRALKKKYEKRYNEIIQKSKAIIEEDKIVIKDTKAQVVSLEIDEEIVAEVLRKLEIFEREETYLIHQISLKEVAKNAETNSKYLSKIINSHKHKNFSTYINDLRIDYFIHHIQEDTKYQKYTIRAIAEEIGFSNPEGFSRAFQKKTGLKPSYFIRKILEDQKNK